MVVSGATTLYMDQNVTGATAQSAGIRDAMELANPMRFEITVANVWFFIPLFPLPFFLHT
jgi:hypothetical protein